jgi:hypothetical protein
MNTQIKQKINDVMETLEQWSMGGIGEYGATMDELNECAERGGNYENNADYHIVQLAWRMLEKIVRDYDLLNLTR